MPKTQKICIFILFYLGQICFTHEKKVYFRRIQPKDAESLFNCVAKNRKYLGQWLEWVDSINTINDERNFILQTTKMTYQAKQLTCVIICEVKFQSNNVFFNTDNKHHTKKIYLIF